MSAKDARKKVKAADVATTNQQTAAAQWAASVVPDESVATNLEVHPARAHGNEDEANAASSVDDEWK